MNKQVSVQSLEAELERLSGQECPNSLNEEGRDYIITCIRKWINMRLYKTIQQRQLAEFFETYGIRDNGKFPSIPVGEFANTKVHTDALTLEQVIALREFLPYTKFFNSPKFNFAIIDC